MISREFTLRWRLGGRASGSVIRCTQQFQSKITFSHGGFAVDGKDVMGLLLLGAACDREPSPEGPGMQPGSKVQVQVDGADADAAMEGLAKLLEAPVF